MSDHLYDYTDLVLTRVEPIHNSDYTNIHDYSIHIVYSEY